jgi:mono/diheme cytochrome c family protein
MKKLSIISLGVVFVTIVISCSDVKRKPGRDYMPDMRYSRAVETYSSMDQNFTQAESERGGKIYYDRKPVAGTIKRGEFFPFPLPKDVDGDSTNYVASKQIQNPITSMDTTQMVEAERLYLINCAICHGPKIDGNGPLYKGGEGPYPAKPATLVGDPRYENMPEGQMFYSATYGKNLMGPYGSQLSTTQRWMIIRFIKTKQMAGKAAAPAGASSSNADSASVGKK